MRKCLNKMTNGAMTKQNDGQHNALAKCQMSKCLNKMSNDTKPKQNQILFVNFNASIQKTGRN